MRYARNVHFTVKSGKDQEFTKLLNSEVIPMLKKQPGFHSEIALMQGSRAVGISVWEDSNSAEEYARTAYPQLVQKLSPVIEGSPRVETFEVAATTL